MADAPIRVIIRENNEGRGRGRGGRRGRPEGGGRGRAVGRGGGRRPQRPQESDDEAEYADEERRMRELYVEAFPDLINDETDDEEEQPHGRADNDDYVEFFERLPPEARGDERYRINNRNFQPGPENPATSIDRFNLYSPIQLVLHFAQGFFNLLLECTNQVPDARITMKDMYCYHAALTLMTTIRIDQVNYYWEQPDIFKFTNEAARLRAIFSQNRYYHVRKYLRAYKIEDDVPEKPVGWKVVRATNEIHRVFSETMDVRDQDISIDEGMAAACSTRNPIYTSIPNKPLEGFRFILAVVHACKICVGLLADLKQFPKIVYENFPGGYAGKLVCTLLDSMNLAGIWYRLWLDNFYNTLALTRHVLQTYSYCIGGTMQKNRKTRLIAFGTAKAPRPTQRYPKGALLMAKCIGEDIFEYGWMDSCGVYFIDSSHGPGDSQQIFRKNPQGLPVPHQVPAMISEYNKFMGGVDVFDQVRKRNGNDTQHATKKYTVRMLEVLWSMCLSQAYNVYRYVNRQRRARHLNPTEFKIAVIHGLITHETVVTAQPPNFAADVHNIRQTTEGSRNDHSRRRKVGECRGCLNSITVDDVTTELSRRTSYYCTKCQVFFHPECHGPWHREKGDEYVPSKQHEF
jgi:hypothetical protein